MHTGFLVARPERKRPLGRPRRGWKDTIKIDLEEVRWGASTGLNWLNRWRALLNALMNFRVP